MDAERISNRRIIKALGKIKLQDNCLLIVRTGTEFAEAVSPQDLSDVIESMGLRNIGIIFAGSTADIGKIPEHRLNEVGWYKLSKVAKMLEERNGSEETS